MIYTDCQGTILMFCIYSLQDNGNLGAGNLTPLGLFFVIFGIGACFGWETGYAINLVSNIEEQKAFHSRLFRE